MKTCSCAISRLPHNETISPTGRVREVFHRSPDLLDLEAVREYLLFLLNERRLEPESINQQVSALKFLYLTTLEMPWGDQDFPRVMRPRRLPVVLSHEEVVQFFDHVPSLRYRAALMMCYGAGLRVSEAVAVKVADIDSKRMLLRVEQGKGKKDRYTMLSPRLLEVLRVYWRAARPLDYLFPSWRPGRHLNAAMLQQAFATMPPYAVDCANGSPSTLCATASPHTFWKMARTCA